MTHQLLRIAYKGDLILNYLTQVILIGRPTSMKRSISQERRLRSRDVESQLNRRTEVRTRISRLNSIEDERVSPDDMLVLHRSRVWLPVQENHIHGGMDVHGPTC